MAYMKKEIRELVEKMENEFTLPANWNEFIYKVEQNHNIIVKNREHCYCTNCQQTFESQKKLREMIKCPHCKHILQIRSNKLQNFIIKDNVMLIDKVDKHLIIRIFELRSDYDGKKQEFEHYISEYSRKIVDMDNLELRNERIQPGVTSYSVNHWRFQGDGRWRIYSGYWYETVMSGFLYKDNMKEVFKDTIYEHSRLWEMIRKPYTNYYNIKHLLSVASSPCFETLVELKLYNLAAEARNFWTKGSFKQIFGVSKDYYEFMKKHNITYDQLELLKIYPTKDIRKIKFLENYKYTIRGIKEYAKIDDFINYFKTKKLKDSHMYIDYLEFAKKLGIDLKNKRYLFPDNLKVMHDEYEKQIEVMEQERIGKSIEQRVKLLAENIFKDKEFIIFPATSVEDLIDESQQQNNCVRTYAEKYADGNCDIYFMRKINTPKISLVTVEVRNNKIVQKRTKNNEKTDEKQNEFLEKWQNEILERMAV